MTRYVSSTNLKNLHGNDYRSRLFSAKALAGYRFTELYFKLYRSRDSTVLTDCLVVEVSQLRAHGQQVWVTASNHQHNCSGRPTRCTVANAASTFVDGQTSNHSSPRPVCLDEVQQS